MSNYIKNVSLFKRQPDRKGLIQPVALLAALLFLNYSALSSYNCQSFKSLNKLYDNAFSELLILEDDSGESIVVPDSFCEVDTGSGSDSEKDGCTDCENCAYCQVSSTGMAFQHVPPLTLEPSIAVNKQIFNKGRSFLNKQITLNHPQRAPPLTA